MKTHQRVLATL
uniref:Uncharacterized protein n=1 Tax=Rhizophora mucronata TaxID=61149 RepID=A0A2P2NIM6_RHIMU